MDYERDISMSVFDKEEQVYWKHKLSIWYFLINFKNSFELSVFISFFCKLINSLLVRSTFRASFQFTVIVIPFSVLIFQIR